MTSTRWCFTLNNYVETDLSDILKWDARYLIVGSEVSASGTPHLQGFVIFKKNYRLSGVKKVLSRAHWEITKGTSKEASDYCRKEGNFKEIGVLSQQGKRTDLEQFKDAVKDGELNKKVLYENYSEVCAKYPRFVADYVAFNKPRPMPECFPLRDWQAKLFKTLKGEPDDREVIFIVDRIGNGGKTWFCKYYMALYSNAYYMRPTKHADMAYSLSDDTRVLFMDCTRQQIEHFPYSFVEAVKDGLVYSSKYESTLKTLGKIHVVVMMNEHPDDKKLSADRYNIIEI